MKRKSLSLDKPSSDQPSSDQPSSDQPSSDQPSSDQPSSDQPLSDQRAALGALAEKGGFTARRHPVSGEAPKVDGRKLRARGRTKPFNMAVKPQTHARFWTMKAELGFVAGEDLLIHLMDVAERDAG